MIDIFGVVDTMQLRMTCHHVQLVCLITVHMIADIPVHTEPVLSLPRGAAGRAL